MKPIHVELPTGLPVGTVNAYLFVEPEPTLVDTGVKSDDSWSALVTALSDQGLTVADLSQVIITHPHVDHFGQAGRIAQESEAKIRVADLGLNWLLDFSGLWKRRLEYYRDSILPRLGLSADRIELYLSNMEANVSLADSVSADRIVTFQVDEWLPMGGLKWQVIHTPGHASMQTCFYQPETRQLLSADMLLPIAPMPIVERPPGGGKRVPSLPLFLKSLNLLHSLEIDSVYPGHGWPFGDHRVVIRRQKDRIQERKEECLRRVGGGYDTIAELADLMYAAYPLEFRHAGMWMLLGYLDFLKAEGRVAEHEVDGVWRYRVVDHD